LPRRGPSSALTETDGKPRLGRLEVVGAWLGLWTPPRAAEVPPVPWRKLVVGALAAAATLAALAAFALPRIDRSRDEGEARERRELAAGQAAERRRIIAEQRPRRGGLERPAGPLSARAERRARRRLLAALEAAITADANSRVERGELHGKVARTECVPAPSSVRRVSAERDLARRGDAYDCLAVDRVIPAGKVGPRGALGYPFRAIVDYRNFRYAWCKTNPLPGERAAPDPRGLVALPRACIGP
jgi:hypothetical protein